jgi:hypothetical protein
MWPTRDGWVISAETHGIEQHRLDMQRWTAERIEAPAEPTLAERARVIKCYDPNSSFDQLVCIVAELAERIEAQS